ncbi:MAG: HAD family phosphatase [Candidatus Omnitrophota bacterium]
MNGVKNIIFDLGGVLVTYNPKAFLEALIEDQDEREWCYRHIVRGPEWVELDRGTLTIEEAKRIFISRNPRMNQVIETLFEHWIDFFDLIEPTVRLLKLLKSQGYGVYLLSNFIKEYFPAIRSRYSFFDEFDGMVVSSEAGCVKPEKEIYLLTLRKFSLSPDSCLFIDDYPANVEAAEAAGIPSILYKNPEQLEEELRRWNLLK